MLASVAVEPIVFHVPTSLPLAEQAANDQALQLVYAENRRLSGLEVVAIHARLDELAGRQWEALVALQREQLALLRRVEEITREIHRATATP
jgi:hypothetical protein